MNARLPTPLPTVTTRRQVASHRPAHWAVAHCGWIEQQAIQDGMQPLTLRALDLARNRQTSLAEVFRIRLA